MKLFIKTFLILFTLMQVASAGRMFDPEVGRFISRDPLGYVDGESLYNAYFAERFALDPMGTTVLDEKECISRCPKIKKWVKTGVYTINGDGHKLIEYTDPKCIKKCKKICSGAAKIYDDDKTNNPCDPKGELVWEKIKKNPANNKVEYGFKVINVDKNCCKEIGILQYFKFVGAGPNVKNWRLDTGDWRQSDASEHAPAYEEPIAVGGRWPGKGGVSIFVTDKPSVAGTYNFLVLAICTDGEAAGHVFGTFEWTQTIKATGMFGGGRSYGPPTGAPGKAIKEYLGNE